MKQTTAVEWLELELRKNGSGAVKTFADLFEQTKEMEKQQIETAYQAGDGDAYNLEETKTWAEQYYNETYGGKK